MEKLRESNFPTHLSVCNPKSLLSLLMEDEVVEIFSLIPNNLEKVI